MNIYKYENNNESGCLICIISALIYISLQFGDIQNSELEPGINTVILGLLAIIAGFVFIAAHYYPKKAIIFRVIKFICTHFVYPNSSENTIFFAIICFLTGKFFILFGIGLFNVQI